MKKITRSIIAIVTICISVGANAHNPDLSSTVLVEKSENTWVLQIRAALTAFEYEVDANFGKEAYKSPEEFRELVIEHVKKNTSIFFNKDSAVSLSNGLVKLGHETSVTFEVEGIPEVINTLDIKNSSFHDLPRSQSTLVILKKGFAKDKFVLDSKNEHTANIEVTDANFVLTSLASKESKQLPLVGMVGASLVLLLAFFVFKNREKLISFQRLQNA